MALKQTPLCYDCEVELLTKWVKGICRKLVDGRYAVLVSSIDIPADILKTIQDSVDDTFPYIEFLMESGCPEFRLGERLDKCP